MLLTMRFKDVPIGAVFLCSYGKFRKLKNGKDKYGGNSERVLFHTIENVPMSILCTVLENE